MYGRGKKKREMLSSPPFGSHPSGAPPGPTGPHPSESHAPRPHPLFSCISSQCCCFFCPVCHLFLSRVLFFCPVCVFFPIALVYFVPTAVCLFCPVSFFLFRGVFFCPNTAPPPAPSSPPTTTPPSLVGVAFFPRLVPSTGTQLCPRKCHYMLTFETLDDLISSSMSA